MSVSFKCPECGQQVEGGQEFIDGYVAENVNRLVDRVTEDVDSYAKKVVRQSITPRQIAIVA